MEKIIITIARQYGSGGRTVGKMLAERLQIPNLILWHTEDSNLAERKKRYTEEGRTFYSGNLLVPDDGEILAL